MTQDVRVYKIGDKTIVSEISDPFVTRIVIRTGHPYYTRVEAEKHETLGYTVIAEVSKKELEEKTPYHSIFKSNVVQHVYKGPEAEKRYKAIREILEKLPKSEEL